MARLATMMTEPKAILLCAISNDVKMPIPTFVAKGAGLQFDALRVGLFPVPVLTKNILHCSTCRKLRRNVQFTLRNPASGNINRPVGVKLAHHVPVSYCQLYSKPAFSNSFTSASKS